ncbi:MAG: hypothetical protein JWP57_708 [Spirosoma sp.]|nr:hypothetical protein [Spirosoma sp.]
MKKSLLLLLVSISLLLTRQAPAQVVTQYLKAKIDGSVLKYPVKAKRDLSLYPRVTGYSSFTSAVATRAVTFTVTSGPRAGVYPARIASPVLPSWLTNLDYSYSAGVLTLRANAGVGKLSFNKPDGSAFSTTNPQSVAIQSGTFYAPTSLPNQLPFTGQWQINYPASPIKLLAQQSGGTATYAVSLTPTIGATNYALIGSTTTGPPSSTTVSPPVTTTALVAACSNVQEQCTANSQEIKTFQLSAPASGTSALVLTYKATEGAATLVVKVNQGGNIAQVVAASPAYTSATTIPVSLLSGANTISISSAGGYLCVSKICASVKVTTTTSATTVAPPPSGNVTTPTTQTTVAAYAKVLFAGNSITQHGGTNLFIVDANNPSRGMAATRPEFDYVHRLSAKLRAGNALLEGRTFGYWNIGGGLDIATGPFMESQLTKTASEFYNEVNGTRFSPVVSYAPDLIYIRLGENVRDDEIPAIGQTEIQNRLKALIDKLRSGNTAAKVVLSTSVWDKPNYDIAIKAIAAERGYPLADFGGMWANRLINGYYALNPSIYGDAGIDSHPDDDGMAFIADKLFGVTPGVSVGSAPSGSNAAGVDQNYVAVADQGWLANIDRKYIENGLIKVGFDRTVGATIGYIAYVSAPNDNFVNVHEVGDVVAGDPRAGMTIKDKGRSIQFGSDYWNPAHNLQVGNDNTANHGFDTGGNVVQGGSLGPYYAESTILASAIYTHPTRGTEFYAKIRPKYWGVANADGPMILEEWVSLNGNAIRYHVRHTQGDILQQNVTYEASPQENPCIYTVANMTEHYTILTPGGQPVQRNPISAGWQGGQVASQTVLSAECWYGAYRPGGGQGLTLYVPKTGASFMSMQFNNTYDGTAGGGSSYISNGASRNYNNAGVYEDEGNIIVGTLTQARAKIATLEGPDQSFDFDWSKMNLWDGRIQVINGQHIFKVGYPTTDNGVTSLYGRTLSPARAWQASGITNLSFDMAVTGGGSRIRVKWIKPGILSAPGTEFSKSFPIIGDGQRRTYTFNMTGAPGWDGVISQIGLEADGANTAVNSTVTLYRAFKP